MVLLQNDISEVPAPYWDDEDGADADDTAPEADQPWYGNIVILDDNLTFVENAFIWVVAGFIVYAGQPGAAIAFVPVARNFVVTVKTDPLGGIIRFLRDGAEIGRTDTYSPVEGVKDVPVVFDTPAPAMGLRAFDVDDPPPVLWIELTDEANPAVVGDARMTLVRRRLSEADFSPISLRYNPDTDGIEYTPDGGVTWLPDPSDDPRHSAKFAKPLQTGGDVRCNSSASMVKWIRDFITYEAGLLSTGAQVVALSNTALSFFDILAPWAILVQGLIDVAGALFGIGTPENFSGAVATYSAGAWHSALSGSTAALWISKTFESSIVFTDAALTDYTPDDLGASIFINGDGSAFSGTVVWSGGSLVPDVLPADILRIDVYLVQAFNPAARTLTEMQYSGSGDSPFGEDNC
jgi:hypothetical protein